MPSAISVSRRRDAWIARVLAADPPRAASLIVTLWGDAIAPASRDDGLMLGALIRLLAPFGVNERLVRTSVFRLARDGWLTASTRGRESRYRLTATGRKRFSDAYRRIYAPHHAHWDGQWQVVVVPPESLPLPARAAVRNELAWAGFGTLSPGVHVRPQPLDAGVPSLPVPKRAPIALFVAQDVAQFAGHALADHVGALWDLSGLGARYRLFLAQFGPGIDLFRRSAGTPASPAQCFVARSLLIHAFRRALLRDPLLPAALLPLDWPGAAAYALTRDFYALVQGGADAHLDAVTGEPRAAATPQYRSRFPSP